MNKNLLIGAGFVVVLAGGIWGGKYWAQVQQAEQPGKAVESMPAAAPYAKAEAAKRSEERRVGKECRL